MPLTKKEQAARRHAAYILRTYGITAEEYEAIKRIQGGFCAICKRANGRTKRLSVDHDHKTGFVRGLLCSTCNKLLGHFRDDPARFMNGYYYLTYPPARNVVGDRPVPVQEAA